jgi:hypothetical protein
MLAVASNNAMAAWVAVSQDAQWIQYADPATRLNIGGTTTMWDLTDYRQPREIGNGSRYLSRKAQYEYDCSNPRTRRLYSTFFAGNMGQGEALGSSSGGGDWVPVAPGTTYQYLWEDACKVKPKSPTDRVDAAFPGWTTLVRTPEFRTWLTSQPPDIRHLSDSTDQNDAILLLSLYKRQAASLSK